MSGRLSVLSFQVFFDVLYSFVCCFSHWPTVTTLYPCRMKQKKIPTVTTKLTPEPAQKQAPVPWKDKHTHKKLNTIPKCNNKQNKLQQTMQNKQKALKTTTFVRWKAIYFISYITESRKDAHNKNTVFTHTYTQSKTNKVLFKSNLARCV